MGLWAVSLDLYSCHKEKELAKWKTEGAKEEAKPKEEPKAEERKRESFDFDSREPRLCLGCV